MSNGEQMSQPQEGLTPAQRVKSDWRSLVEKVSYKAIVNNIPFLAYVVLLCMLYISNSHRAIELQRAINTRTDSLKEMRWKYLDTKSQLVSVKSEKMVIKKAENIGLTPSMWPAYKVDRKPRP
jgi:cell division protein FtsL